MQNTYSEPRFSSRPNPISNPNERLSIGSTLQDLMGALRNLAKSEAKLIRAEVKSTLVETGRDTLLLVIFGMIAFLGLLPFLAFLIILTGQLLGNNYWLSALLVSLFFTGIGVSLGAIVAKRFTKHGAINAQSQN